MPGLDDIGRRIRETFAQAEADMSRSFRAVFAQAEPPPRRLTVLPTSSDAQVVQHDRDRPELCWRCTATPVPAHRADLGVCDACYTDLRSDAHAEGADVDALSSARTGPSPRLVITPISRDEAVRQVYGDGRLTEEDLGAFREELERTRATAPAELRDWLGRYISALEDSIGFAPRLADTPTPSRRVDAHLSSVYAAVQEALEAMGEPSLALQCSVPHLVPELGACQLRHGHVGPHLAHVGNFAGGGPAHLAYWTDSAADLCDGGDAS